MTRKHFAALAWKLRLAHPFNVDGVDIASDWTAGAVRQWDRDTLALADVCATFNGGFDRGRFLVAAGYTHRPDGSMYPATAPK